MNGGCVIWLSMGARQELTQLVKAGLEFCNAQGYDAVVVIGHPAPAVRPCSCLRCGSEMKVLAIILKPQEIKRILHHLVKQGRPPPGADLDAMNLFFLSHAPLMVSECILTSTFRPFMRIFSIFLEN